MAVTISPPLTAGLAVAIFMSACPVRASSPDAWQAHDIEVKTGCLKASGLKEARLASGIVRFGDELGFDALLIRGQHPQAHMGRQETQILCLFNRSTRCITVSEVPELQP